MKAHALICLNLPDGEKMAALLEALKPETKNMHGLRSIVRIKSEGNALILDFEAEDTASLRAVINSYLHWVCLTRNILNSIDALQ